MRRRPPARLFGGLIGAYVLVMHVLVGPAVTDLYHRNINDLVLLGYLYAGMAYVSYALSGKQTPA